MPSDKRNSITAKATVLIFFTVLCRFSPTVGLSDTAILVSRLILKPLFTILNSSRYLQICQS